MADKGGDHGHGGGGGIGLGGKTIAFGIGLIIILIALNGFGNMFDGQPLFKNVSAAPANASFSGLTTTTNSTPSILRPGSGYVSGAPTSARECVARGGRDLGRGCAGYK